MAAGGAGERVRRQCIPGREGVRGGGGVRVTVVIAVIAVAVAVGVEVGVGGGMGGEGDEGEVRGGGETMVVVGVFATIQWVAWTMEDERLLLQVRVRGGGLLLLLRLAGACRWLIA